MPSFTEIKPLPNPSTFLNKLFNFIEISKAKDQPSLNDHHRTLAVCVYQLIEAGALEYMGVGV
jgi:hypothetical protein